jgi:glycosyltransferase involved in cell wall biosynthesis
MRVLHIIEGDGGGAVTHVLTQASRMSRREVFSSVAFVIAGTSVGEAEKLKVDYRLFLKKLPLFDFTLLPKLIGHVKRNKIDIIHSHTIRGNFYARLTKFFRRRSLIALTTVHSYKIDELKAKDGVGFKDRLLCRREICTFPLVDHFICVSSKIRDMLLRHGIEARRTTVIENGVDLPDLSQAQKSRREIREEFSVGGEDVLIGIIGRLVALKNHDVFLQAARKVSDAAPNVRFLVIGDGPLFEPLKDAARDLGIQDRVTFTGWRNDVARIIPALDIYSLCSRTEGLNMTVLEAMAFRKPVVGTDISGINDLVVPGESGLLVAPGDASSLTEGLLRLVSNAGDRGRMGQRGRELIEERYTVDRMIDRTLVLYKKLKTAADGACAPRKG